MLGPKAKIVHSKEEKANKKTGILHPINSYQQMSNRVKNKVDSEKEYYKKGGTASNKKLEKVVYKTAIVLAIGTIISLIINYWWFS